MEDEISPNFVGKILAARAAAAAEDMKISRICLCLMKGKFL
jgi:hypothetical protein